MYANHASPEQIKSNSGNITKSREGRAKGTKPKNTTNHHQPRRDGQQIPQPNNQPVSQTATHPQPKPLAVQQNICHNSLSMESAQNRNRYLAGRTKNRHPTNDAFFSPNQTKYATHNHFIPTASLPIPPTDHTHIHPHRRLLLLLLELEVSRGLRWLSLGRRRGARRVVLGGTPPVAVTAAGAVAAGRASVPATAATASATVAGGGCEPLAVPKNGADHVGSLHQDWHVILREINKVWGGWVGGGGGERDNGLQCESRLDVSTRHYDKAGELLSCLGHAHDKGQTGTAGTEGLCVHQRIIPVVLEKKARQQGSCTKTKSQGGQPTRRRHKLCDRQSTVILNNDNKTKPH